MKSLNRGIDDGESKNLCINFLKGILAGICIAIGGFLYIKARESTELIIVPAFYFQLV